MQGLPRIYEVEGYMEVDHNQKFLAPSENFLRLIILPRINFLFSSHFPTSVNVNRNFLKRKKTLIPKMYNMNIHKKILQLVKY